MRDRSRINNRIIHVRFERFAHRATAALRALSRLSWAVSFMARAFPPFNPPKRPSTTAAAFFVFVMLN
ncbi:MAG TPA: hypothetical protein VN578_00275 [Candidatus Binatia bacterium]|jgi:hypothetical protein|nr:hypothetical protein [Candidatus Binatia bacterium]